jgi:hypothetical protein
MELYTYAKENFDIDQLLVETWGGAPQAGHIRF